MKFVTGYKHCPAMCLTLVPHKHQVLTAAQTQTQTAWYFKELDCEFVINTVTLRWGLTSWSLFVCPHILFGICLSILLETIEHITVVVLLLCSTISSDISAYSLVVWLCVCSDKEWNTDWDSRKWHSLKWRYVWKEWEDCRGSAKAIARLFLSKNWMYTQHLVHIHKIVTFFARENL